MCCRKKNSTSRYNLYIAVFFIYVIALSQKMLPSTRVCCIESHGLLIKLVNLYMKCEALPRWISWWNTNKSVVIQACLVTLYISGIILLLNPYTRFCSIFGWIPFELIRASTGFVLFSYRGVTLTGYAYKYLFCELQVPLIKSKIRESLCTAVDVLMFSQQRISLFILISPIVCGRVRCISCPIVKREINFEEQNLQPAYVVLLSRNIKHPFGMVFLVHSSLLYRL